MQIAERDNPPPAFPFPSPHSFRAARPQIASDVAPFESQPEPAQAVLKKTGDRFFLRDAQSLGAGCEMNRVRNNHLRIEVPRGRMMAGTTKGDG